jgi:hypothetical protein
MMSRHRSKLGFENFDLNQRRRFPIQIQQQFFGDHVIARHSPRSSAGTAGSLNVKVRTLLRR